MAEELTLTAFLKYLNDGFQLQVSEEQMLCLELIRVVDRLTGPSGHRKPFSIEFRGPLKPVLPQRIYRLEHPAMGELEIFLVPVGPDQKGMVYEAVFN